MKGYTSLPQSKKLAEILPLESADMKWYFWKSEIDAPKLPTFGYSKDAAESYKDTEAVYLPCWSLAALLKLIPKEQHPELMINAHYNWICDISNPSSFTYKPAVGDNPVDACYEMILKLHELDLL